MKLQIIEVFILLCLFTLAKCSSSINNEKYDNSHKFETKSLHDVNKNCKFCKWLIDNYKWGINNSLTVREVQKSVIQTCEIFKKEKKESCISFILGVGANIINDIIKNKNTIKICQTLNLCYFQSNHFLHLLKSNIKYATQPDFYDCKTCQKHIGYLEKSLETSLSPEFVLKKLKKGCNVFKHFQKQNCIVYYDQIGIQLIKLMLLKEKPKNICKILSYCKNKIEPTVFKSNSLSNDPSKDCKICKYLVQQYEVIINDDLPILEIQKAVIKVCDIYNENLRQQCISFYSGIGLEIIKAIVKKEDPEKVCQKMKLCLNVKEENEYNIFIDAMTRLSSPSILKDCTTCTNIITWFQTNMNLSKTPEEDQHILLGICVIFKYPYNEGCVSYYNGVGFEVVKYILNKTDPETICKHFQFCQSKKIQSIPLKVSESKPLSNDPNNGCEICKSLVTSYEIVINDDLPVTEIQKAVIIVCDLFNEDLRQQCISFYSGQGLEVIKAIIEKEDPTTVCQILHLCLNKSEKIQEMFLIDMMTRFQSLLKLDDCTTCIKVISWDEMNMDLSKTAEEDQHILLQYCEIFKCPYHDQCVKYYTGTGYEIIKYILNKTDPESICKQFHLCQSRNKNQIPLK